MATPHTRGSTREMIDLAWEIIGYPAYAGIDPTFAIFILII